MPPIPPVTKALMLLCTAVYFFLKLFPSFQPSLMLWPMETGLLQPWQFVTYAFLHGNWQHLFFNMLGLFMFGIELEQLWGPRRYLAVLLASTLTAALVQQVFNLVTGSAAPMVGASGALFGLLLSHGMLFPDRIVEPVFPSIPMKTKFFVLIFGCIELTIGFYGDTGVAHFAHLGGMLGAYLLIRYWRSPRRR